MGNQVTKSPVNGTNYLASSIFKNGDYIGPAEYVVYNGTGNSVTLTNITEGKTYFFRLFEYTCYPPYFLSTNAFNNPNGYTLGATIPTIKSVIADNVIKNEPALVETYNFFKTNNAYIQNNPINICADGTSSTVFRIKASSVTGVNIQLYDELGTLVIDGKNSTDFAKFGVFSYPPDIKGDTLNIIFTHPQYMDISGKQYRQLFLRISFNGVAITGINIPLRIFRAPVLMVPGIWSSETDFNQLITKLTYSGDYSKDLLSMTFYNESSAAEFEENDLAISEGIMTTFNKLRGLKYSAGKIDLLAQGTGGVLARRYIQENGSILYRNDVNRLITINTPHNGTQIGNLLTHTLSNPAKTILNLLGFNANSGAVSDIKVNSTAIASLNATAINHNSVPLYSIHSELDYKDLNIQSNDWSKFLINIVFNSNKSAFNKFDLSTPEGLADYIYYGEKGDAFVPISSQKGGIQLTNQNEIKSSHFGTYSNAEIFNIIAQKLNENPNDPSKFWKNGFAASPQLPYRSFIIEPTNNFLVGFENDSVRIVTPLENSNYYSGDSIFVSCKSSPGISNMFAVVGGDKRIFGIIQSTGDSLGQWIHIPVDFAGTAVVYCSGSDENSFVDDDTLYINIIPKAAIDSIQISPEYILVGTGNYKNFNIYGYFHDGIKRKINDLPGIQNKILIDSIAQIINTGKILGKKIGNTKLFSSYQGKKDSIDISVYFAIPQKRADFEVNNNSVCQGGILRFENTSTGNPDSLKWIFEAGKPQTSNANIQFVEFDTAGLFDVTLIAYFDSKIDTLHIENYVNVIASPEINVQIDGSGNFCEGESVTLTANDAIIYNWSNGEKTKSIQVKRSGDYLVTITDELGCSAISDTILIVFNPIVSPQVTISADKNTICSGEAVVLESIPVNGGNNPKFTWFINGNIFPKDSSVIILDSLKESSQIYCMMESDAKCLTHTTAVSNFISINVEQLKTPEIGIIADKLISCKGENVHISAKSSNAGADPDYKWFVDGKLKFGNTDKIESDSFLNRTLIYCTLKTKEKCVTDSIVISDTIQLEINDIQTPKLKISSTDTLICAGKNTVITSDAIAGGADPQYQWYIDGIIQPVNTSMIEIKNIEKDIQVFCIMISDEKCISTPTAVSNFINIKALPVLTPSVTISTQMSSIIACDNAEFTANPVNAGHNPEIKWFIDGNLVGEGLKFNTSTLLNGSQVYCKMKSSDPCNNDQTVNSNIIILAVNPMVQPVIKLSNDSIIAFNYKGSKYNYKWFFNGNNVSSKESLKCSDFGSGFYYLVVENNNCSVTSNTVYISCTTGNKDAEVDNSLLIYPNPSSSDVNLFYRSGVKGIFEIRDIRGILQKKIESDNNETVRLKAGDFSEGIYIVEFISDNGSERTLNKMLIVK